MKSYIFISYKSEEFDYADRIRTEFEQNGVLCWMAPESIGGGSSYAAEIPKAIRGCDAFVLILSKKSQESVWVKSEVDMAKNMGKLILPFVIEKMNLNDEMTLYLNNVQQLFAYKDWNHTLNNMIDQVCEVLDAQRRVSQIEVKAEDTAVSDVKIRPKKNMLTRKKKKLRTVLSSLVAMLIIGTLVVVGVYFFSTVDICGNRVSKNITELILEDSEVSAKDLEKISSLERLIDIKFLDCRFGNTVNSLSSLPKSLTGLYIINCKLDDELLNSLNNEEREIIELDISENPSIKNPSLLQMKQLKYFHADYDGITNLDFLENCIYLETVDAAHCMITDINGLKNVTQLNELNLNNNRLNSLKGVEKSAKNIGKLYLENNQFTDMSFLKEMNNLEWLNLSGNSISDISPLYGKTEIIGFDISHNHIKMLDAGNVSLNLRYVDLSYNDLEKIDNTLLFDSKSGVGSLNLACNSNLTTVSFQGKNFSGFDVINLQGCPHVNLSSLYSCQEVIYLVINYREDLDFNIINEKLNDTVEDSMLYLIDCPLYFQASVKEKVKHVTFISSEKTNEMETIKFEKLINTEFSYLDYYPYIYWWVNGNFPNRIRQQKR